MTSKIKSHLKSLRLKGNTRTHSPRITENWPRLIRWRIGDEVQYWRVDDGIIVDAEPVEADMTLTCDQNTLSRMADGDLPFFIAIWATGDVAFEGSFGDAFRLGYIFLTDHRGRRVVFLAHCFLNTNTRFPGGCAFSGATVPLIQTLLDAGVGIVQMPCPEFLCLGLEKPLYGELVGDALKTCFRKLAVGVIDQVEAYLDNGYQVAGIIGMNPSPSCGVEIAKGKGTMLGTDRDTSEKGESGVFIDELRAEAASRGLTGLPFFGVRRMLPNEGGLDERMADVRQRLTALR